jgi:glucose dehydrogenase
MSTDQLRYPALTKIDAANLKQLRLAALIQAGAAHLMETTPIEINGVLYVEMSADVVQAYDAITGEELWAYTPALEYTG